MNIQSVINAGPHAIIWPPDTAYNHFQREPFLTVDEINTINDWINNGMPQGDPYLCPPGPIFTNESSIDNPDTIVTMAQHFTVPGDYQDHCKVFVIPSGFTQEKFVRALEFNPCILNDVHHILISIDTTGTLAIKDANTPGYGLDRDSVVTIDQSRLLTIYSPYDRVSRFPVGVGYRIPAGADLILKVHYIRTSIPIDDSLSLNIFFDDTTVHQEVHTFAVNEDSVSGGFDVLPNIVLSLQQLFTTCNPWSLLSISPQLDGIGKSIKFYSVNATNDTIPLIHIPVWNPDVRRFYLFLEPVAIDAGSAFFSEATFDNTINNPANPNDPPEEITHDCSTCEDYYSVYLQVLGDVSCLPANDCLDLGIEDNSPNVQSFSLQPNPARDQSMISFSLRTANGVSITIYDLCGRVYETVIGNAIFSGGKHDVLVNAKNFSPGLYLVELKAGNEIQLQKFVKE